MLLSNGRWPVQLVKSVGVKRDLPWLLLGHLIPGHFKSVTSGLWKSVTCMKMEIGH